MGPDGSGVDVALLPNLDATRERSCRVLAFLRAGQGDGVVVARARGRGAARLREAAGGGALYVDAVDARCGL